MKHILIVVFGLSLSIDVSAQYIPDKQFDWVEYSSKQDSICKEIFKVVEEPPVLNVENEEKLKHRLAEIVNEKSIGTNTGTMKIIVTVRSDNSVGSCKVGAGGIRLESSLVRSIADLFQTLGGHRAGRQRGRVICTQVIVYATISNGKVTEVRLVNGKVKSS